jgi:putative DNA primase/helicase
MENTEFQEDLRAMEGPAWQETKEEVRREQTRDAFQVAVGRLASLSGIEREHERKRLAKALGVRASALDAAVKQAPTHAAPIGGTALKLDPRQPWPEPVLGSELLSQIEAMLTRYVVLSEGTPTALSLWVIFTYAFELFRISPRLALLSPTPRCGKTTVLTLLTELVQRPLAASNITPAAVFRTIEVAHPTLLIDEADTFLRDNEELRGVLNSGHSKGAAYVIRTVGEDHEPRQFSTWCPLAIAMIGHPQATLKDRAVVIEMRRKRPTEKVERLKGISLEDLAGQAARWVLDNRDRLAKADPPVPQSLDDRAADNWRPLLAIADVAGGEWPSRARAAAETLSAVREETTAGVMLLNDLRDLFGERQTDRLASETIVEVLGSMEGRSWADWRNGKPLTVNQLANLLKEFKVGPGSIRIGGKTPKGYKLADLQEAFDRYLPPPQTATPPQPNAENDFVWKSIPLVVRSGIWLIVLPLLLSLIRAPRAH